MNNEFINVTKLIIERPQRVEMKLLPTSKPICCIYRDYRLFSASCGKRGYYISLEDLKEFCL